LNQLELLAILDLRRSFGWGNGLMCDRLRQVEVSLGPHLVVFII